MHDELITLDRFWELIESPLEESGGDSDAQLELLAEALAETTHEERVAFPRQLHGRIDEAYTWDLWAAAYIVNGGCSDDGFLTALESDPEGEPWKESAEALRARLPGLWAAHGWE